jgi:hypothetical protein
MSHVNGVRERISPGQLQTAGRRPSSSISSTHPPHLPLVSGENISGENICGEHRSEQLLTASPVSRTEAPRIHAVEFVRREADQQIRRTPAHGSERSPHAISRGSNGEISPSTVRRKRGSIRGPEGPTSHERPGLMESPRSHEHGLPDRNLRPSRTATVPSIRSTTRPVKLHSSEKDFGGFPSPYVVLVRLLRKFFPRLHQRLTRTVTIPHTATVQSKRGGLVRVFCSASEPCFNVGSLFVDYGPWSKTSSVYFV